MRHFLTVFGCITMMSFSFSQGALEKDEILKLFKEILISDQTELKDSTKRAQIFRANYFKIIGLIENQGFVNVDSTFQKEKDQKTVKWGFTMTFTHILDGPKTDSECGNYRLNKQRNTFR